MGEVSAPNVPDAIADAVAAQACAHLWVTRTAGVARGLTHRFGNGLHALSLIGGDGHDGLAAEDAVIIREELDQFEVLTEQYRALILSLEEEPAAGRVEDAVALAVALRGAHVEVRDAALPVVIDGEPPAVLAAPLALAQALLLLLLGERPEEPEQPTLRLSGDDGAAVVELRAPQVAREDAALDAGVRWLLRATQPAVTLDRTRDAVGPVVRLTLPSLRASRRAMTAG
jgi:hypothetical protein